MLRGRWIIGLLGILALPVSARELAVTVLDRDGTPLAEVVVSAEPTAGPPPTRPAVMDQIRKTFVPYILPVQVGTTVDFPNSDSINHHVYSFSPAKRFELKLFKGETDQHTVLFDKAGVVTLGCNLHDWMLGYIVVLDTPWFAQTNADGIAHLRLPDQDVALNINLWHPRLSDNNEGHQAVPRGAALTIRLQQALKPDLRRRRQGYD